MCLSGIKFSAAYSGLRVQMDESAFIYRRDFDRPCSLLQYEVQFYLLMTAGGEIAYDALISCEILRAVSLSMWPVGRRIYANRNS